MPAPMAPPPVGAPKPPSASLPGGFSMSGPGSGSLQTAVGGYNNALNLMGQGLNASNNTTSSQLGQLGQQLQQNQASIGQNLTNRGLGNTTIAQTMQQAPQQTYNMGVSQVQNQGAMRNMQQYNAIAGMQAQGGQQLANSAQPYAQTNYQMSLQHPQGQQVSPNAMPTDFGQGQPPAAPQGQRQQNPYSQFQNLQPSGQGALSFGPGQPGGPAGTQAANQWAPNGDPANLGTGGFGMPSQYLDPNSAAMQQVASAGMMGDMSGGGGQ